MVLLLDCNIAGHFMIFVQSECGHVAPCPSSIAHLSSKYAFSKEQRINQWVFIYQRAHTQSLEHAQVPYLSTSRSVIHPPIKNCYPLFHPPSSFPSIDSSIRKSIDLPDPACSLDSPSVSPLLCCPSVHCTRCWSILPVECTQLNLLQLHPPCSNLIYAKLIYIIFHPLVWCIRISLCQSHFIFAFCGCRYLFSAKLLPHKTTVNSLPMPLGYSIYTHICTHNRYIITILLLLLLLS